MIYELRIYHMHPGKMEAIHKRFSEVTINLFAEHHMKTIDFWEDAQGSNTIYYVLEHKDIESRNANFNTFQNDERWIKAKTLSEKDGLIVEKVESYLMTRVPYSPNKA